MTGSAAQIDQAPFGEHDYAFAGFQIPFIYLGLDIDFAYPWCSFQIRHVNFIIKMPDIADNGLVFHLLKVLAGNNVVIAGCCNKDIANGGRVFHGYNFIAFHCGLQRADGINFCYEDSCSKAAHGLRASLAHITIAADYNRLASHHYIGCAFNAICQGFPAAIEIVEF